ncbi:MAG TPA: NADH-quinone oxidoreductase subunit NuoE [Kiloniellales bacterium]
MRVTSRPRADAGDFAFTADNQARAKAIIARYPAGRQASAVVPLLDLAQRQTGGWLPKPAIEYVADMLEMAPIRAHEVATFYTMFNLQPVGKYLIQVCRTTPCWLRGAAELTQACQKKLGVGLKENTADGLFTAVEVECLGACANAPMVQINDDYYEDLSPQRLIEIIDDLKAGRKVPVGSQAGRQGSAPSSGAKTLTEVPPPGARKTSAPAKPAEPT